MCNSSNKGQIEQRLDRAIGHNLTFYDAWPNNKSLVLPRSCSDQRALLVYGFPINSLEKARVRWLTDGDQCTKVFHAYCRTKMAHSSINSLYINGVVNSNPV